MDLGRYETTGLWLSSPRYRGHGCTRVRGRRLVSAAVAASTWPAWVPVAASLVQAVTADHYGIATTARFDIGVHALIAVGLTLVFIRPSLRRLRRR